MRLVGSELLKLRTTPRTVVGLVMPLLAIVVLGTVGNIVSSDEPRPESTLADILAVAGFAGVIAMILGVLVVTWEFRHGTITGTFLVVPRRERVVAAKAAAASLAGALLAVVAAGLGLAIAYVWIGGDPGVSFGDVWGRAARMVGSSAIYGALGVGLGAIVRGQALAIVLGFVWFLVVEPLVFGLYDDVGRYLPGRVLTELAGASGGDVHLPTAAAVGLSLAYGLALVAVGTALTVRRDVA